MQPATFELDPREVAGRWLVAMGLVLLGLAWLDWVVAWDGDDWPDAIRRLCNAAREDGLASWLATVQAAATAALAWACWRVVRAGDASARRRAGWLLVALVTTWLAVDEGARLHERLGTVLDGALRTARRDPQAGGVAGWLARYPSYGWQLVVAPPLAAAALFFLAFLGREAGGGWPRRALWWGLALVAAAVALDFVEGLDREHPWNVHARLAADEGLDDWSRRRFGTSAYATIRHVARVAEELVELWAGALFIAVLLACLLRVAPEIRLRARAAGE